MLFYKIGGTPHGHGFDWQFLTAAILTVLFMFIISTISIPLLRVSAFQAGTFSQTTYRFNTYIGMAIVLTNLGEIGIKYFGILISFAIPLINLFAVSLLIWFGGKKTGTYQRIKSGLQAVVSNPLILGCLAGIAFSRSELHFPTFIDNTLQLISMVTLPLALLSIGSSLTLRGVKSHFHLSLVAAFLKLVIMPLVGYGLLILFKVETIPFKVAMIFFSLPASTAIYVLSSQLNSDTELASCSILLSTLLSFLTLSLVLLL